MINQVSLVEALSDLVICVGINIMRKKNTGSKYCTQVTFKRLERQVRHSHLALHLEDIVPG